MHYTFDTDGPIELAVEIPRGRITLVTAEVNATEISVEGDRADEVDVRQNGRQVTILAPRVRVGFFSSDPAYEVHVTMPHDSEVVSRTGSADVDASGRYGSSQFRSGSGNLEVERLNAPAVVESGSGDIRVHQADGELRVKSGSGDVSIGVTTTAVAASTGSGDVEIGQATGPVVVKTGSGDLRVATADSDVSMQTGSGAIVISRLNRGKFSLKGASGDVSIGIPAGTPVWTDITSVSGRVRSNLTSVGEPAEGQDFIELRARTVSGDLELKEV